MGWWLVNADTLAGSRFVVSPLAEVTSSLKTLERGTAAHPGERGWLDVHLPAYRERLADDPVTALLVRAGLGRGWNADFLTPTPVGEGEQGFEEELARVRETPAEVARADLAVSLGGSLPAGLRRSDLPERAAGLLEWVWREAVLPYWSRRRRIIEADVVARTGQLGQGGWVATLEDMRLGMRWLGEGRLQINAHDYPPLDLSGARLMFVPVTPRQGWVSWEASHRYAVVYPCSGVLAAADRVSAPETLGALLGSARASVLVLLDTPKSTTQLVALTGQGLGSVGRHLRVLLEARLVWRRRAGRSVLYCRTDAGEVLVRAQGNG
ncbi:ArsR/SmtB family transcription factor [Streptosporangium lutulentum]|uniref:DNA-binding transcriptional ArsR family regulator n=1 Tax=Streptosporangium lutulentum TaxID=1461250 RepID=A0ABT9QAV4_9ACTN|nr:winged helix-turn-helix domain-containing protein [Streptosporangium lutulentum]MDP9843184.1 DNA-binding transcriptional ArsR family regulator [Streptosporangium lutulentum]